MACRTDNVYLTSGVLSKTFYTDSIYQINIWRTVQCPCVLVIRCLSGLYTSEPGRQPAAIDSHSKHYFLNIKYVRLLACSSQLLIDDFNPRD